MDKQQLLKRFQTNYLSRQDVLFKLPLNISIDTFWPELISWRKSRATMLPLYNAFGQPYWYVTTDKMVRASERLCTEALDREDAFDPYRIQMTQELSNALTMESYYTSFVEGADYTLEDAIAFLRRGTEPENVYEQNYLNNYQALSYLLSALSVPIDEHYVKDLAFILTDGQLSVDGQNDGAVNYRTEDTAPIPAMEGEEYTVPSSFALPNLMSQLYAFLADINIHPLIKAAVSQAFILTTRPFPEGNDRLARIISSAVLLRCGYEFFLDISISSHIAKENYRYFKAMKEIIRKENEGDLTYFVEYYLTLLVRALESAKAERTEKERQAERQMAMQPLAPSPPVPPSFPSLEDVSTPPISLNSEGFPGFSDPVLGQAGSSSDAPPAIQFMTPEMMQSIQIAPPENYPPQDDFLSQDSIIPQWVEKEASIDALIANAVSLSTFEESAIAPPTDSFPSAQPQTDIAVLKQTQHIQLLSGKRVNEIAQAYSAILQDIAYLVPIENFVQKMMTALDMGMDKFDSLQWGEINLLTEENAIIDCNVLYRAGILDRYLRRGRFVYLFRFEDSTELAQMVRDGRIISPQVTNSHESELFWSKLALMESSVSDTLRRGAGIVRDMIQEGIQEFSKDYWISRAGMSENEYASCRNKMMDLGLIVNLSNPDGVNTRRPGLFRFTIATQPQIFTAEEKKVKPSLDNISWEVYRQPVAAKEMLETITTSGDSTRALRIHDYLLPRLGRQNDYFTAQDWELHFQISRTMAEKDIRKALNLGLLTRNEDRIHGEFHKYRLISGLIPQVVSSGLGDFKKVQLIQLYHRYGTDPFALDDFSESLDLKVSSASNRIDEYIDRGYILAGKCGNKCYYRIVATPEACPECFRLEETTQARVPMMATA